MKDFSHVKCCAYDGCRKDFQYVEKTKVKTLNGRYYCNQKCLNDQYKGLKFEGAAHLIHQTFGPLHPVTVQVREMFECYKVATKLVNKQQNDLKKDIRELISKMRT